MSNVTNLGRFRKAKARDEKRRAGDANAAKFGRTKAEKRRDESAREKAERGLDGHKREE
ncbi:protein of unknown function [Roseivivax halotolerans]|jgi:hypothetical protein|uniref:DUF4169 domain-containing protein n=1 Tax=Roseivivax halotolerans TaxID=93684 RepID=A0A1I5YF09_9RHOB|nr:DUF4169 family protein [Roseivivax halotolerans]SFQ42814.1 protein of unknown function [Roseivivax halotolerans]